MGRNRTNDIIGLFALFLILKELQKLGEAYFEGVKDFYHSDKVQKHKDWICTNIIGNILWGTISYFGIFLLVFVLPALLLSIPVFLISIF